MKITRRIVELVIEHPHSPKGDRPRVFGYSAETIAALTDRPKSTILRHIKAGKLNLGSIESTIDYLAKAKTKAAMKGVKATK